jgi:hypothetical protein
VLASAPVLVWLGSDGYCLLLTVADVSPQPPVRLDVRPDAEGGRGLALVEALSDRWGWFLDDHPSWSAWWDKHAGLWRVAEDDIDSDLYAESRDADVVIQYMRAHSPDTSRQPMDGEPRSTRDPPGSRCRRPEPRIR